MQFFKTNETETDPVLCGYMVGILSRLVEVCSPQMTSFLASNRSLLMNMLSHLDSFSIAQLAVTLVVESFALKEKKSDVLTEESLRVSSMERSYQNMYASSSRSSLFREIYDVIFPCFFPEHLRPDIESSVRTIKKSNFTHQDSNVQDMLDSVLSGMKSWTEGLQSDIDKAPPKEEPTKESLLELKEPEEDEGPRVLINEVLKEEIKKYPGLVAKAKAILADVVKFVIASGAQARKIENVSFVLYSILCKFIDLISQHAEYNKMNNYMHRMGE